MTLTPPSLSGSLYHSTLGQVRYSIKEVSDNPDIQVVETIGLMREYAKEDAHHPLVAQDVRRAWRTGDALGDTFHYLRRGGTRGMEFVQDETTGSPFGELQQPGGWRPIVETLIRPADQALLTNPQGDCDDFAMYGAAHLIARGVRVAFATVGVDRDDPTVYSHVYLVAYPEYGPYAGMRVPLDLSHGPYVGWECPNPYGKFKEWPLDGIGLLGWGMILGGSILLYRALKGRVN